MFINTTVFVFVFKVVWSFLMKENYGSPKRIIIRFLHGSTKKVSLYYD